MQQFRKTPRAAFLNYDEGDYFITICTHEMRHYFGEIIENCMYYSELGKFAYNQLSSASALTAGIEILVFTVMPNHIHAIVRMRGTTEQYSGLPADERTPNPALRPNRSLSRTIPALSKYVNSFKGAVTKYANNNRLPFKWQSRYHDHFIRGRQDEMNIWNYIETNVEKWDNDCFAPRD